MGSGFGLRVAGLRVWARVAGVAGVAGIGLGSGLGWGLLWAGIWSLGADLALALLVRQPLHRWFVTLHHGHERRQLQLADEVFEVLGAEDHLVKRWRLPWATMLTTST